MWTPYYLSQKDTTKLACAVLTSKNSPQPCIDIQSTAEKHIQSSVELGEIQKQTHTYDVIFDMGSDDRSIPLTNISGKTEHLQAKELNWSGIYLWQYYKTWHKMIKTKTYNL